jgi:2-polyprenyl-3-methyl-5-hydroxy-6-metoxy-1,4-benzoquinol methylase
MTVNRSHTETVRRRFERDAGSFDAIYRVERSWSSRWFNRVFRKAIFERYEITFAEAGDVSGKAVLDVGCGSGVYSADFARRGARRVVGVDFSAGMREIARQEAVAHGVADRCEFRREDFMTAAFDEAFDVGIAMGVFDYLPEPVPFLAKMASLTSGKIIASFPGHSLVREPLRTWRYRLSGKGAVCFYHRADVARIAAAAGLREPRIIPVRSSGSGFILVGGGLADGAVGGLGGGE